MLHEYIVWTQQKHNWMDATFNDIAWESFYKAMNKFQGHQNSIRKYVHGWLPVAEMVRWYNDHKMTICPCCRGREWQDHVLRCPNAKAAEYRKECFQEFWDQLEKTTDPRLLVALKEHVRR